MDFPARTARCAALFQVETTAICFEPADHDGDHAPFRSTADQRVSVDHATHTIPAYAVQETCLCGRPAAHKIAETSGPQSFHPMTGYLCCGCFTTVLGPCRTYPYDLDEQHPALP